MKPVIPAISKPVNPAPETITVDPQADQVSCDGGGGPMGHPLVYYSFDRSPTVACGYCDRVFTKAAVAR